MEFIIENISNSMAITIGNALRRTALTELSSWCIESINLDHEFGTIEGIVEDIPQIILNLKQVNIKKVNEAENVYLAASGPTEIYARDIKGIECANPDLLIATINAPIDIKWNFTVKKVKGYVAAKTPEPHKLFIDMIGTVVTKANYEYKDNNLILTIETNGVLEPKEALNEAINIFNNYLSFADFDNFKTMNLSIDNLNLETRSYNCLKYAGIDTIEELCEKTEEELMQIKNFGIGTLNDIKKQLKSVGYSLKE